MYRYFQLCARILGEKIIKTWIRILFHRFDHWINVRVHSSTQLEKLPRHQLGEWAKSMLPPDNSLSSNLTKALYQ